MRAYHAALVGRPRRHWGANANIFSRRPQNVGPTPRMFEVVKNVSSLAKKNGGRASQPLSLTSERLNRTAWIEPSQFLNLAKDQFLRGRMVSGTMTLERNGHGTGSVSPVPTDP